VADTVGVAALIVSLMPETAGAAPLITAPLADTAGAAAAADGVVPVGLSAPGALTVHSITLAPARIAAPKALPNTCFIAFSPTASMIVEELGRRVNYK
jgi:hypothetical protein